MALGGINTWEVLKRWKEGKSYDKEFLGCDDEKILNGIINLIRKGKDGLALCLMKGSVSEDFYNIHLLNVYCSYIRRKDYGDINIIEGQENFEEFKLLNSFRNFDITITDELAKWFLIIRKNYTCYVNKPVLREHATSLSGSLHTSSHMQNLAKEGFYENRTLEFINYLNSKQYKYSKEDLIVLSYCLEFEDFIKNLYSLDRVKELLRNDPALFSRIIKDIKYLNTWTSRVNLGKEWNNFYEDMIYHIKNNRNLDNRFYEIFIDIYISKTIWFSNKATKNKSKIQLKDFLKHLNGNGATRKTIKKFKRSCLDYQEKFLLYIGNSRRVGSKVDFYMKISIDDYFKEKKKRFTRKRKK